MSHLAKGALGLAGLCLIAVPLATLVTRASTAACAVTTTKGDVQGLDLGASCSFLGIPYAASPVGTLRWKPPQPAAPWANPLPAIAPPPNCPNVNNGPPAGNEDCLKLNVWVRNPLPATPAP
jgi:para-nitrobenzyl esterase